MRAMIFSYLRHTALATTLLLAPAITHAIPFIDADAFAIGDKKAIYETTTGLTWLDFGITNNKSFNAVLAELETTYAGWRLPTEDEIKHLWNNTITTGNGPADSEFNHEFTDQIFTPRYYDEIFSLWGANLIEQNELKPHDEWLNFYFLSDGMFLANNGAIKAVSLWERSSIQQYQSSNQTNFHEAYAGTIEKTPINATDTRKHLSTLLVKKNQYRIPEPATHFLFAIAIACLWWRRQQLLSAGLSLSPLTLLNPSSSAPTVKP